MMNYSILLTVVLSFLMMLSSCQDTTEPEQQSNLQSSPDFLLIADEDPLNIETESAFMIDGAGPIYFAVLNLTDEQKNKIKEIVAEFRDEFHELHGRWNEGISWEEIREERRALHEKIHAAIYEILTDEQKSILDDIKTQLENGEYPDILVENKVAHLDEKLNLSAEQQEELTKIFKEYGTLLIAARNESENRFDFIWTKMELFMELDVKIREVLTDDQLVLYGELKSEHRRKHFRHHRWRN